MNTLFRLIVFGRLLYTTEGGQRAFRPWGMLGPSYIVDARIEQSLLRHLGGTVAAFIVAIVLITASVGLRPPSTGDKLGFNLGVAAAIAGTLAYFWFAYRLTRGLKRA